MFRLMLVCLLFMGCAPMDVSVPPYVDLEPKTGVGMLFYTDTDIKNNGGVITVDETTILKVQLVGESTGILGDTVPAFNEMMKQKAEVYKSWLK